MFYEFNLQALVLELKKGEEKFSSSHSERLGGEGVWPAGVTGRLCRVREPGSKPGSLAPRPLTLTLMGPRTLP